jgi:hypothetical protein
MNFETMPNASDEKKEEFVREDGFPKRVQLRDGTVAFAENQKELRENNRRR